MLILGLQARRTEGDRLRLSLQVDAPQQVLLRLFCFQSGWIFEEELGLILPGHDQAELSLPGWPEEASLLQVEFRSEHGAVERLQRWLAAPRLRAPFT